MKKSKKFNTETLGGRLKGYEREYEKIIENHKHIIVRIDGHRFSKFTRGFNKPFDEILSKTMEMTTIDLCAEFKAYTGYTQSDEITLVIPSLMTKENHKGLNAPQWKHGYSGRVQKLASLIAAFATMSFNKYLRKNIENDYNKRQLWNKLDSAWFDARVYGVDSDEEAFNSILWRIRDAEKNSRSVFAQTYCSHKKLQNKTGLEQVQYCLEKTGKDWNKLEDRYKYGILVKKELYMKETQDNDEIKQVQRSRFVTFSKKLEFSKENVELIMSKYKNKE